MGSCFMDKKPAVSEDTTEYLLRSEENRKRLLETINSQDSITFTWKEFEAYSNKLLKNHRAK